MDNKNTLVAYFSRKGENTSTDTSKGSAETVASALSRMLDAPEYKICTVNGYPESIEECNKVAKKEHDENARPELRNQLPLMDGITQLILVYPNWWGDMPMAVYTFLDGIDTAGLYIYPVCTHEDNGLAMTERILAQSYPKANIQKGIALRGSSVQADPSKAEETLRKYLSERNLLK